MRYFLNDLVEKVFQSLGPFRTDRVSGGLRGHRPRQQPCTRNRHDHERTGDELAEYAFPSDRPGHIAVAFSSASGIDLSVSDNGVGLSEGAAPEGLESRIVQLLAQTARRRNFLRTAGAWPQGPGAGAPAIAAVRQLVVLDCRRSLINCFSQPRRSAVRRCWAS